MGIFGSLPHAHTVRWAPHRATPMTALDGLFCAPIAGPELVHAARGLVYATLAPSP